jgi:cytochrome c oxidase assembly protein Cox11
VQVDTSRQVEVQFVARITLTCRGSFIHWNTVLVHPGESRAFFLLQNPPVKDMVAQAIPNVFPTMLQIIFIKQSVFVLITSHLLQESTRS